MRAANWRSASGGIASSPAATRYQAGSDLQAGAHHVLQRGRGQGLLDGVHDQRPGLVDVCREVAHEVVLR